VSGCCGDIPNEVLKEKVVSSPHLSRSDNKGSGETAKKGIISKLGAFFSTGWNSGYIITPIVLIFSIFLLFFLKGRIKGGKD